MTTTEELAEIRRDMDLNIQAIARWASRVRVDHRQTRDLIARALNQVGECRKLLKKPAFSFENEFARESVLEQAERHMRNTDLLVMRQEEIVARLRDAGEDSRTAATLLAALKAVSLAHSEEFAAVRRRYEAAQTRGNAPRNDEGSVTTSDN